MSNQEIKSFLTQSENLELAFEIADYVEEIKRQAHSDFWAELNDKLLRILTKSSFAGLWHFQPFNLNRLRKDWEKCYLQPTNRNSSLPLLQFSIGQAGRAGGYRLFCGVVSFSASFSEREQPALTLLKGELVANNLTIVEPDWHGWNYLPHIPNSIAFIKGMTTQREQYVQETALTIWDLFSRLQPYMDAVNELRTQVKA